jgi:hypothetical protein
VSASTTVGSLTSADPDDGSIFTYSLVAGSGSTDNNAFTIVGSSLNINSSPDFEIKSAYNVRVRSTDQGNLFFEKQFTIHINDVPETITGLEPSASHSYAVYPNPASHFISISIENKNSGSNQTHIYSISNSWGVQLEAGYIHSDMKQVDVSKFPTGIYYLKMQNVNSKFERVTKFVVAPEK